jgi:phosphate transport system permease protein
MATSYQQNDSLDSAAEFTDNVESRETLGKVFEIVFLLGLLIGIFILALLLFDIFQDGLARFFNTRLSNRNPFSFS